MITHHLTFGINPIAKGRPKFARHAFTPARTREYENAIAVMARDQFHQDPFTGPIKVSIIFYMPTHFQKRWGQPHTFVPDADNLAKSTTDALKGIVWKDDSTIALLVIEKVWAKTGSVEVSVTELGTTVPTIRRLKKKPTDSPSERNETISTDEYLALTHEGKSP